MSWLYSNILALIPGLGICSTFQGFVAPPCLSSSYLPLVCWSCLLVRGFSRKWAAMVVLVVPTCGIQPSSLAVPRARVGEFATFYFRFWVTIWNKEDLNKAFSEILEYTSFIPIQRGVCNYLKGTPTVPRSLSLPTRFYQSGVDITNQDYPAMPNMGGGSRNHDEMKLSARV